MFFKIFFHGDVNIRLPPIIMAANNRTRCQHHRKLWVIPSTCLLYQNTFHVRCVPIWNSLPCKAVQAETTAAFQMAGLPIITFCHILLMKSHVCRLVNYYLSAVLFCTELEVLKARLPQNRPRCSKCHNFIYGLDLSTNHQDLANTGGFAH